MTSEVDVAHPSAVVAHPMDGTPPWARLLLYRVWRGIPIDDARAMDGSKVSKYLLSTCSNRFPAWHAALMDAQAGALVDCPVLPDDITRAWALDEEQRRHDLAMTASEKYAHPYLRLGMEAGGRVGSQANSAPAANAIQINIVVQAAVPPVPVPRDPHSP